MNTKFNIGEIVKLKEGFSSDSLHNNYVGRGYSAGKTREISSIMEGAVPINGKREMCIIYFFTGEIDGVIEEAIESISEARDRIIRSLDIM